ncbi:lipase family protein [Rhodococcus sp. I2R]|uniref:lipase family protein n=1 Tax=Rhodococcus sp. I2R TaxID=2855445 RepID=UPI001E519594|nr:lipase family protein [Rhodococcus sp. I2R]MCC8929008.1 lipase family protein [Rhodococcus sp. I2R]
MKLIYLHGVGSGDTSQAWLEALNTSLAAQDLPLIDRADVIAPHYSDILSSPDAEASIPKSTVNTEKSDRSAERAQFINRQIEAARVVGVDPSAQSLGFPLPDLAPSDAMLGAVAKAMPDKWFAGEVKQIQAYVHRKGLRGAVLTRVLESIPEHGEIVIVGHSLGSVVTVDLLSRLPIDLSVRRVVTIGSPAHTGLFAVSRGELIGNFPYARTNSWLNFFSGRDPVTRARGLASVFADVQDIRVSVGAIGHGSAAYLGSPSVARAVGSAFHQSALTPRRTTRVRTALTDDTAALILELHYRYAVSDAITDSKTKARFIEAIRIKRLDLVAQIWEADKAGLPLPRELHLLAEGTTPKVPDHWSTAEIIEQLTILAFSNLTTPFEIDVSDPRFNALPDFAEQIGLTRDFGTTLAGSLRKFNNKLAKLAKPGTNWQRWAIAGAGVAVIAIGPIGLIALAPAGAAGAAAMTGGLAALGPGGMAGGLATIGGIAGTGAAITTAATVSGRRGDHRLSSEELLLAVAVAYAQKKLGHDFDDTLWMTASTAVAELSAQINTVEALSDPKAPSVAAMVAERDMIQNLVQLMESSHLTPETVRASL